MYNVYRITSPNDDLIRTESVYGPGDPLNEDEDGISTEWAEFLTEKIGWGEWEFEEFNGDLTLYGRDIYLIVIVNENIADYVTWVACTEK